MREILASEVEPIVGSEAATGLTKAVNLAIGAYSDLVRLREALGNEGENLVAIKRLSRAALEFAQALNDLPCGAWLGMAYFVQQATDTPKVGLAKQIFGNADYAQALLGVRPDSQSKRVDQIAAVSSFAEQFVDDGFQVRSGTDRNIARDAFLIPALARAFQQNTGLPAKSWNDEARTDSPTDSKFARLANLALLAAGREALSAKQLHRILGGTSILPE